MSKLKLLIAFAIGYTAGSAAGRQRYEQIRSTAQKVAGDRRVQSAAQKVQDTVAEQAPVVADKAKGAAVAAAGAVHDKVTSNSAAAGSETDGAQPPAPPVGGAPIS